MGGAEPFDHYGMTEVGPVAYETPGGGKAATGHSRQLFGRGSLSRNERTCDGRRRGAGPRHLGRAGCPLFRYRTGDIVKSRWGEDDAGQPTLDLLGGILGRADDMVVVRGVNLYPASVDAVVCRFDEVAEYQVTVDETAAMTELKLRAEAPEEVAAALEKALTETFSLRIPVQAVEPDSLPRFEMKARRWKRVGGA